MRPPRNSSLRASYSSVGCAACRSPLIALAAAPCPGELRLRRAFDIPAERSPRFADRDNDASSACRRYNPQSDVASGIVVAFRWGSKTPNRRTYICEPRSGVIVRGPCRPARPSPAGTVPTMVRHFRSSALTREIEFAPRTVRHRKAPCLAVPASLVDFTPRQHPAAAAKPVRRQQAWCQRYIRRVDSWTEIKRPVAAASPVLADLRYPAGASVTALIARR